MNFPLYIARRIGLKNNNNRRVSPGIIVGYVGVSLAISIMLLSLFIVNGFKKEIIDKLLGFNAPISIYAPEDLDNHAFTPGIKLNDSLMAAIHEAIPNAKPSLTISQPAILKTDNDFQGIILKGIDTGSWEFFSDNIIDGSIPTNVDGENSLIVSATTASRLGINVGDRLTTHFLDHDNLRTRKLTVTGIFETHFQDFDNSFAATPLAMLQTLNHVDSILGTGIEIREIPYPSINEASALLSKSIQKNAIENHSLEPLPKVSTLNESCGQYLSWLELLDTNVIVIIILMACVSGFTLISSLFIIILEKVNTIGLLKSLGATNGQIRKIFIYMAQRLVIRGILIGDFLAIAIALVQKHWKIIPLDPEAYYLNNVPIDFNWLTIINVNIAAIILATIILILPSHFIARLSPASTLRYE